MSRLICKLRKMKRSELIITGMWAVTMLLYLYCILSITLIDRTAGVRRHVFTPLWEVRTMFESREYMYWTGQIGGNLIMLFPLGFLLPIISDRFRSVRTAAFAGFVFSLFIEFMQYLTGRGLFESDDILHNTIGACAGCFFYVFISDRVIGIGDEYGQ